MMMLSLGADSRPADRRSEGLSRAGRDWAGTSQRPIWLLCPRLIFDIGWDN